MAATQFGNFVVRLCTEKSFLKSFRKDAVKVMKANGLSEDEIAIILSEDSRRISAYVERHDIKPKWRITAQENGDWRMVVTPAVWKYKPSRPRRKRKVTARRKTARKKTR